MLRLLFVFFEKRGGRLSLSQDVAEIQVFGAPPHKTKKKQRIIKMIEEKNLFDQKEKAKGNFKKQKQKRTPFQHSCVCVSFLRTLPSFFVQRLNKVQETETGRRA